jgi:hypothetical protein
MTGAHVGAATINLSPQRRRAGSEANQQRPLVDGCHELAFYRGAFYCRFWFFAVFSGIVLPGKPGTFVGVLGSFPRGNAVAVTAKLWTMLPMASGGLAALPPGRFHVEMKLVIIMIHIRLIAH